MKPGLDFLSQSQDFRFFARIVTMPKLKKNETLLPLEGYTQEEWSSFTVSKRYRLRHPTDVITRKQRWRLDNKEQAARVARNANLKLYYGITSEDYDRMLKQQNGCCAICGTDTPTGGRKYFCVDHCHASKQVRGLLCGVCNKAIGLLKDSPALLQSAIDYLAADCR